MNVIIVVEKHFVIKCRLVASDKKRPQAPLRGARDWNPEKVFGLREELESASGNEPQDLNVDVGSMTLLCHTAHIIEEQKKPTKRMTARLLVDQTTLVEFQIDTGATCNVLREGDLPQSLQVDKNGETTLASDNSTTGKTQGVCLEFH